MYIMAYMCIYTDIHVMDLFMYYWYINVFIYLYLYMLYFFLCMCVVCMCVWESERLVSGESEIALSLTFLYPADPAIPSIFVD